jgi:hypothetical protein
VPSVTTHLSQTDLCYRRSFLCSYEGPPLSIETITQEDEAHVHLWMTALRLFRHSSLSLTSSLALLLDTYSSMRVQHVQHTTLVICGGSLHRRYRSFRLIAGTGGCVERFTGSGKTRLPIQEYKLHTVSRRHSNLRDCPTEKSTSALLVWC